VHISSPFEGTITVTDPDGSVTTITGTANPAAPVPPADDAFPAEVEDMVGRHEKNGHAGTRSRQLTRELIKRGWSAKAGPKYLRFVYAGDGGKVTLYANSRDIMTRHNREFAEAQPGAIPTANEVRWRYVTDEEFEVSLSAADSLAALVLIAGGDEDDGEE
jgi:hypothetical protein